MPPPLGEGEVWYSRKADRFYQQGRRGAVSREQALPRMEYVAEKNRWVDVRGNFVPDSQIEAASTKVVRFTGQDGQGRTFLRATFVDKRVSEVNAFKRVMKGDEMLTQRTVITTPDGKTHVFYTSGKLGQRISKDALNAKAKRGIRGEMLNKDQDYSYEKIGKMTRRVSYVVRKVKVTK